MVAIPAIMMEMVERYAARTGKIWGEGGP